MKVPFPESEAIGFRAVWRLPAEAMQTAVEIRATCSTVFHSSISASVRLFEASDWSNKVRICLDPVLFGFVVH